MKTQRSTVWLSAAAALMVWSALTFTRADADLWGHLRFGLDMLRDHAIPSVDPYSFTQDTPWINHEWLSEVQMAMAWSLGRSAGLAMLKGTVVFAALVLVWGALDRVALGPRLATIGTLAFGTIHIWSSLRPQVWTSLFFVLLCRILASDDWRAKRWLPLIFALWANCHGGWIVGLGVIAAWACGRVIAQPRHAIRWVAICGVCGAATLLNPYGWRLWTFMLGTVHLSRPIAEWGPLWTAPWLNWIPWFLASAFVAWRLWVLRSIGDLRESAAVILALGMLAFASARVMRIESLFVLAAAIFGAASMARIWPRRGSTLPPADQRRIERASPAAAAAAVLASVFLLLRSLTCIPVFGDWVPDAAVAHALDGAGSGRLVTFFDWGEFAIWHFGSRLRVSMDGRRETVYTAAPLATHDAILTGAAAGVDALQEWRAEYVWLPARSARTRIWLVEHGYRIEVESPRSFLAVRSDLPRLPIQGSRMPADCFPQ